jgi:hypothetical protein
MQTIARLTLAAITLGTLSACAPSAPAFQRNVGPGSTVDGIPSNNMGPVDSGNTQVPGVSQAGPAAK